MDGSTVGFALTRFEAVAGGRLEVEGTWSGVRGMRFVRPALVVHAAAGERTLLAVLEHKPWPAEDGRPWRAAFPWDGGALDPADAELAVAPSVVVPLAAPDPGAAADPQVVLRHRLAEAEERARRLEAEVGFLRRERDGMVAPDLVERRRAAVDTEHAAAQAALLAERDAAATARRAALAERDEARAERDAARSDRDAAQAQRDSALRELADRERQAQGSAQRREAALQERDVARREREEIAERQRAVERETETVARERERVAAQLEDARGELRSAEVERDHALSRPAGVVPRPAGPQRAHAADAVRADWAARIAAIVGVLVLLVLAITFLKAF
ncbi:MAG TPA: hypothetical protein VGO71_07195 [Baekduia sp.]|jgi:hypothetical protein|nr:hypothetical protein [Baekduia sp.]